MSPTLTDYPTGLPREAWPRHWHRVGEEYFDYHSRYESFWCLKDDEGVFCLLTYRVLDAHVKGVWAWVRPDRRGEGHVIRAVQNLLDHENRECFEADINSNLAHHYSEMGFDVSEKSIRLEVN